MSLVQCLHKLARSQLQCDLCEQIFVSASELRHHKILHNDEKLHKCKECDETFTQSGSLKRHIRIHTGEKTIYLQRM